MEIETAFNGLMDEAEKTCCEHPDAEQVIAVKTAKGNTYILVNRNVMSGDYSNEKQFYPDAAGKRRHGNAISCV